MGQENLQQHIEKSFSANQFGSLATVENDKPKVRYMAFYHENMKLYLATDRKTHKVDELEKNPSVAFLAGFEQGGSGDVIELEGTAKISGDDSLKSKIWRDDFKQWFNGPDDPDYVVIEVTPSRIEYTAKGSDRQVWTA